MAEVTAIVLAASLSRRMGAPNKLLLEIGGEALILRVVRACTEATGTPPIVVLGHEADRVAAALNGLAIRAVLNADHASGQMTSVACGLRAAPPEGHCLIALGDQPRMTADVLYPLIGAHLTQAGERITVPLRDRGTGQERGNPILIPAGLRARILDGDANLGCRNLTRDHPELVHRHVTDCDAFFVDIDTPEDLAREREAHGRAEDAFPKNPFPGLRRRWRRVFPTLTREQADLLAHVKFPCC